jgi:hypothetical protein
MKPITERIHNAETLWASGETAEKAGNYSLAYTLYTEAHDEIMDCARLHQFSHEKLRRVNWKLGHYGELVTDWLLHLFAPLGVFELVSRRLKTDAQFAEACKSKIA